ncbi:MAG: mycofactocin system FadH/OYE family oxidoreductase 1 [Acidimicrobiales bacterium]
MASLLQPLVLGSRTARNRVVFGPHETNLARRRAISDRHLAYYRRRAVGGAGVIVIEEAAVHESDWPYERSPLASDAGPGWTTVAAAGHDEGAIVLAALGHSGGQGSSAYNQAPLWAPSRVPEVNSREVPKWMEASDIAMVLDGFAAAARLAVASGLDGVEVNAGQHSLIRQFLSGLTNQRDDDWGADKSRFATHVLRAVRGAIGDAVLGLRLCCDELAPWAGITPEDAPAIASRLADHLDYVTVVKGSIFSVAATRPDGHTPTGFNAELARSVRAALPERVTVIAQGSIVEPGQAEGAIADGACDGVEMTRAQIADPDLVRKLHAGEGDRVRPCILCNQTCQVRDARNPIVTCVVEPRSGHEWEDQPVDGRTLLPRDVLVVGGGVAGLECARVAAQRGHRVTIAERSGALGGMAVVASCGAGRERLAAVAAWLETECARLDVKVETSREVTADELAGFEGAVVLATGSRSGRRDFVEEAGAVVLSAAEVLAGAELPDGAVAVWDPIGGPVGISVAEGLRAAGRAVHLITPDLIAGNELSRSGDLAPANVRLQSSGVVIERRSNLVRVRASAVEVEDRFTGELRTLAAVAVVDAGHRLPDDALWRATGSSYPRAGDAVAPRTIHEAILEGRRRAMELDR